MQEDLQDICWEMSLEHSGTKWELAERLRSWMEALNAGPSDVRACYIDQLGSWMQTVEAPPVEPSTEQSTATDAPEPGLALPTQPSKTRKVCVHTYGSTILCNIDDMYLECLST